MPVAPAIIAQADPDDVPTGSIGRYASASMADRAIFLPRLDFAVAPVPAVLASLAMPSDRGLHRQEALPLPPPRPKLAYARPDFDLAPPPTAADARTAVYDIEAGMVYLPSGRRLEAHSGLGDRMDDPASVRIKNRGVTPPNIYDLKLRESLFHGVQAIRMNPVDEDKMFGRDGILAHSYMLGASGQSNGCVSFKNYPAFLQVFQRGEVDRIVVLVRGESQRAAQLHGRSPNQYALDDTPVAPFASGRTYARTAGAIRSASAETPRVDAW